MTTNKLNICNLLDTYGTNWLGSDITSGAIPPITNTSVTTSEEIKDYVRSDILAVLDAYADFHRTKKKENVVRNKDFYIKKAIFNKKATIVIFEDDTKIIVKCQRDDTYSRYAAITAAVCKKLYGSTYLKKFLDGKTSTIIEYDGNYTITAKKEDKKC